MYLLDTNIISELRKISSGKVNPNVLNWFKQVNLQDAYISVVTIFEIKLGVLQLARKDPRQAQHLQHWLENTVLSYFKGRILALDTPIMLACAELHIPDKKSLNDSYIAATAKTHRFKMVTRNTKDFENCGIELINPFE